MSDRAATAGSYVTSGATTVFGVMTVQEWVTVIGLAFMAATFIVNWYYKHRDDKRKAELAKAALERR